MNAAPDPVDPSMPPGAGTPPSGAGLSPAGRTPPPGAGISAAADRARAQLHEEIERVRAGVEEMLAEQPGPEPDAEALRRELDALREDTRLFVKKRVRRTEKKLERSISRVEERTEALERRIDQVEADRRAAEWRIHNSTEQLLDGMLREMRAIGDLLTRA